MAEWNFEMSEKANTAVAEPVITPKEAKRLEKRIGAMFSVSALLRDLLLKYLDKKDHEHKSK